MDLPLETIELDYAQVSWNVDGPPPPEPFPHGWENNDGEMDEFPKSSIQDVDQESRETNQSSTPAQAIAENSDPPDGVTADPAILLPGYLVPPNTPTDRETVHMITVVMRASGDKTRDVLRIRRIHGVVMSFPGNDRFALRVYEKGHGYLIEFPNFTTGLCPELISRLKLLVGSENVTYERITFQ